MQLGAYDFVTKPFDLDEICATAKRALQRARLQQKVEELREKLHSTEAPHDRQIVGSSRARRQVPWSGVRQAAQWTLSHSLTHRLRCQVQFLPSVPSRRRLSQVDVADLQHPAMLSSWEGNRLARRFERAWLLAKRLIRVRSGQLASVPPAKKSPAMSKNTAGRRLRKLSEVLLVS